MTLRAERRLDASPAKALAALATAAESQGYTVRDVDTGQRLLLLRSRPRLRAASLGFIVSAKARRSKRGCLLAVDLTPVLGSWAISSGQAALDDLLEEFQLVLSAPRARIRPPKRVSPGTRPFGYQPEVLGVLWVLSTLVVYGLVLGGWFWLPVAAAAAGAGLLLAPRTEGWWNHVLTGLAVVSLPFGVLGAAARRLARANLLWAETINP